MAHTDHLKYGAISFLIMLAIVAFTYVAMEHMKPTSTSHITSKE